MGSNGTDGWRIVPVAVSDGESDNEDLTTTACGGVGQVLGGHCATSYHTIEKTYTNLPNHAEVQITARIHFLDNWDDDTMWMKMGLPGTVEQAPCLGRRVHVVPAILHVHVQRWCVDMWTRTLPRQDEPSGYCGHGPLSTGPASTVWDQHPRGHSCL